MPEQYPSPNTEPSAEGRALAEEHVLTKVLKAHFQSLVASRSDPTLLKEYAALLRFLKANPQGFLAGAARRTRSGEDSMPLLGSLDPEHLPSAPLEDIERIVNSTSTPRSQLDQIAIKRFSVPRGSMRRFSSRTALLGKIRELIEEERAHQAITNLAKESGTPKVILHDPATKE